MQRHTSRDISVERHPIRLTIRLYAHVCSTLLIPKSDEPYANINTSLSDLYNRDADYSEDDVDIVGLEGLGDVLRAGDGSIGGH